MKWLPISVSILGLGLGFGIHHASADNWFTPYCPSGTGTLRRNVLTVQHACEKLDIDDAKCSPGWDLMLDGVFKDKCQKQVEDVTSVICALNFGEAQANWHIVVEDGPDQCKHNAGTNGVRQVKCVLPFTRSEDHDGPNPDKCVDVKIESKPITCPTGADHKVAGRDKCEQVTFKAPEFH